MNGKVIKSVLKEYGVKWVMNRSMYSIKLRIMAYVPQSEKLTEKKVSYPNRLNIFDIDTEKIEAFIKCLPEKQRIELKRQADDACKGKILGFSSLLLDYGYPINWQLNPLTGKECDINIKWYKIPDFDPERGDIKAIWEVSRFSHFIILARAYLLTKDKKYYRAFSDQLADWIDKNPYSYGVNFKCGQECSFRMINGLLAYTVFSEKGMIIDADKKNIETLILRCYRKILSNFFYAYKCIKNNHTISELVGMIIGAWCCGEEKRLSYAFNTLDQVIDMQFTTDGGYRQYSFNYQRLVLQDLEVVLSVENKVGYRLNSNNRKKILAAANLMYQCQDEISGDVPNYGCNDGALVFPITSCKYRDFRPDINTVSMILDGKRLYKEGIYDESFLWFGNSDIVDIEKKNRISTAFNEAGLYTLRSDNSWAMIVLNDYKSRPAHMDQLHFDLWVEGLNVLCDGGTYSYALEEARAFGKNERHNTIVYDNKMQMNRYGAFMVYNWTKRGRVKHTEKFFYGEMISMNGYEHHREVRVTNNGYEIIDEILGDEESECKLSFHTPCDVREKNCEIVFGAKGNIVCVLASNTSYKIRESIRSLYYLQKEKVNCIEYTGRIKNGKLKFRTEIKI